MSRFLARALAMVAAEADARAKPPDPAPEGVLGVLVIGEWGGLEDAMPPAGPSQSAAGGGATAAANDGGPPDAGAAAPFTWPEGVDYHLTQWAARLSGEVAAGASWQWCPSGALDVEQVSGKMWLLSPVTMARLREARLLPEALVQQHRQGVHPSGD